MTTSKPSSNFDTRFFDSAIKNEESENGRYSSLVKIERTPDLPAGAPGSAVTAFNFTLTFRDVGAATVPLTWLLAASEADCAPVDGLQFSYAPEGEVSVRCWFGQGWFLEEGFTDFIGLLATHPRTPGFAWTLEMLPDYAHVAARAIDDPIRFEQIGEQVRAALLDHREWIIPEVRCPCAHRPWGAQDAFGSRVKTASILQRLRSGLMRWRNGGVL